MTMLSWRAGALLVQADDDSSNVPILTRNSCWTAEPPTSTVEPTRRLPFKITVVALTCPVLSDQF
jgi:hypothetical protein